MCLQTQNETGHSVPVEFGSYNTNKTGVTIMTTLRAKMKHEMTLRGLSPRTQEQYIYAVTKLHDHYKRSPAKLNEQEIKSFLLFTLSNKSYAASTYNVMIHGLKFFYEIVLRKKMVEIVLPRQKEPQKLPDILSPSEVERIIKATFNLKHRTMLILIYGAGLRASEVVSLRVKDIDSERSVMHIRQGKGNKDRYVTLSPLMLRSLRHYWKKYHLRYTSGHQSQTQGKEDNLIFPNSRGESLSAISVGALYKRAKNAAGIKKQGGVHSLRHAFATHSLEAGMDLYTLKQLLGHSNITSTVRYLRMTAKKFEIAQSPVDRLNL